jgi:hypothetical protein
MKITKTRLKEIIKEELQSIAEGDVVDLGKVRSDKEREDASQKDAEKRALAMKARILRHFASTMNEMKTEFYEDGGSEMDEWEDASEMITAEDLFAVWQAYVVEHETPGAKEVFTQAFVKAATKKDKPGLSLVDDEDE